MQSKLKTGIIYDNDFTKHSSSRNHVENPKRVKAIIERLQSSNCLSHPNVQYVNQVERYATQEELQLGHPKKYIEHIDSLWPINSHRKDITVLDSYFNKHTCDVSRKAVGALLQAVDRFSEGVWKNGFGVVRPPGHHSGYRNTINGFCVYNNVAITAKYAVEKKGYKKVAVLDWDVHHGDGTQHILQSYDKSMFISIHRYDQGSFYPANQYGDYKSCGKGAGEGFNLNIPLNALNKQYKRYSFQTPGDNQYIYIFERIIYPIFKEYNPDIIMVSAGFDAAKGDPLGGFNITPNGYAYMTARLSELAEQLTMKHRQQDPNCRIVPLLMVLEGGYNLTSTSLSACSVVSTLIGDKKLNLSKNDCYLEKEIHQQVDDIVQFMSKYWPILKKEQLTHFTTIVKSNKNRVFEEGELQSSSSSSDEVDEDQNEDRPKNTLKKQQKDNIKGNEKHTVKKQSGKKQVTQQEGQSSLKTAAQFYFAAGHMQRFKNFSLDNQKILKWSYDSQIQFYENKNIPEKQFAPKYYGRQGEYAIIENLLYLQKDPIIVMDIKLSRQSKNPLATEEKKQKERKKQIKSTSHQYAFRISGYTTPQFKEGGLLNNDEDSVRELLKKVVSKSNKQLFVNFLNQFSSKMKEVKRKYYGTSIVLIKGKQKSVIRWIDFHYWVDNVDNYDQDLVEGIQNLRSFIEDLQPSND